MIFKTGNEEQHMANLHQGLNACAKGFGKFVGDDACHGYPGRSVNGAYNAVPNYHGDRQVSRARARGQGSQPKDA